MLIVPKGAGRRKLPSNMKLKHGLENSILLKLLVLQMFHWLLPFFWAVAITAAVYKQQRTMSKTPLKPTSPFLVDAIFLRLSHDWP